jgi:hypothetical protein
MSEVTQIRPDAPTVRTMDEALADQREALFQAMGVVRMASYAIQEPCHERADTDAWTALNGAYALLSSIADRLECSETMLAKEVPPRGLY